MRRLVFGAIVLIALGLNTGPASAQAPHRPPDSDLPNSLSYSEFQGLACLMGGAAAMVGVATYSEFIVAATGGATAPVIVPILAAGFAAGCSVASTASPGLLWIYRRIYGVNPITAVGASSAASFQP
jgi:hypothetical protein